MVSRRVHTRAHAYYTTTGRTANSRLQNYLVLGEAVAYACDSSDRRFDRVLITLVPITFATHGTDLRQGKVKYGTRLH